MALVSGVVSVFPDGNGISPSSLPSLSTLSPSLRTIDAGADGFDRSGRVDDEGVHTFVALPPNLSPGGSVTRGPRDPASERKAS